MHQQYQYQYQQQQHHLYHHQEDNLFPSNSKNFTLHSDASASNLIPPSTSTLATPLTSMDSNTSTSSTPAKPTTTTPTNPPPSSSSSAAAAVTSLSITSPITTASPSSTGTPVSNQQLSSLQQQQIAADRQADAMATLKLRRLTNLTQRLRTELNYERIPASQACEAIIQFTQNAQQDPGLKDYLLPDTFGHRPLPNLENSSIAAYAAYEDASHPPQGAFYYEDEEKTLISPTSAKFSTKDGRSCCIIS